MRLLLVSEIRLLILIRAEESDLAPAYAPMVSVNYIGRLGNNLFQYVLGRIIAQRRGYQLTASPIPGFPGTRDKLPGGDHSNFPPVVLEGNQIDLAAVLNSQNPSHIILDGFFQRSEYFTPLRETIREWLRMEPGQHPGASPDLLVHVRRTDYVQHGWALPFEFYEQAIKAHLPAGGRLMIATDDPMDPFFLRFRQWRPAFFRGSVDHLMRLMTEAPRFLMSQSSFSWWPAFLGVPDRLVLCPDPVQGIWSGINGVSLADPALFTCLPCGTDYTLTPAEAAYQKFRLFRVRMQNKLSRVLGKKEFKA